MAVLLRNATANYDLDTVTPPLNAQQAPLILGLPTTIQGLRTIDDPALGHAEQYYGLVGVNMTIQQRRRQLRRQYGVVMMIHSALTPQVRG